MKKRVLSALMVLCMVLTLLPVSAFAAPNEAKLTVSNAPVTDIFAEESANRTIYVEFDLTDTEAKWSDSSTMNSKLVPLYEDSDQPQSIPAVIPPEGYELVYWETSKGTLVANAQLTFGEMESIVTFDEKGEATITYTPVFEEIAEDRTIYVEFDLTDTEAKWSDSSTMNSKLVPLYEDSDQPQSIPAVIPPEGYELVYWETSKGTLVANAQLTFGEMESIVTFDEKGEATITYTPVFEEIAEDRTIYVEFDLTDTEAKWSDSSTMNSKLVPLYEDSDQPQSIPAVIPPEGYELVYWETSKGTLVANAQLTFGEMESIVTFDEKGEATITYTPVFEEIAEDRTIYVEFDLTDTEAKWSDSSTMNSKLVPLYEDSDQPQSIPAVIPPEGYELVYWETSKGTLVANAQLTFGEMESIVTFDEKGEATITYTPVFEEIAEDRTIYVEFDLTDTEAKWSDSSTMNSKLVPLYEDSDQPQSIPAVIPPEGYELVYWETSKGTLVANAQLTFGEMESIVTFDEKGEATITYTPVFEEIAEDRTIYVEFDLTDTEAKWSDSSTMNSKLVPLYEDSDQPQSIPAVIPPEGYELVYWETSKGTLVANAQLTFGEMESIVTFDEKGEATITYTPVFEEIAEDRTIYVEFDLTDTEAKWSDSSTMNSKLVPLYEDSDQPQSIPAVIPPEGYELVYWETSKGTLVANAQLTFGEMESIVTFDEKGEATITYTPVFEEIAEDRTIYVEFDLTDTEAKWSDSSTMNSKLVPLYEDSDQPQSIPAVIPPEGYELVYWETSKGTLGANAQLTFGEMESIVTFDEKGEATITYTPVFEEIAEDRTIYVEFDLTGTEAKWSDSSTMNSKLVPLYEDSDQPQSIPAVIPPEGYELVYWETSKGTLGANAQLTFGEMESIVTFDEKGEATITYTPVFEEIAEDRTIYVEFDLTGTEAKWSDSSTMNSKLVPLYEDSDQPQSIPAVIPPEGYELVYWETSKGTLGANAQLTFGEMESIVTFDEKGEATITYTPVFEEIAEDRTIYVEFDLTGTEAKWSDSSTMNSKLVPLYEDSDQPQSIPAVIPPEGYELVYWETSKGTLGANAQLTFGEMESIVTFDEKGEATITYTPVFEEIAEDRTIYVEFDLTGTEAKWSDSSTMNSKLVPLYEDSDQPQSIPAVIPPEGYELVYWETSKGTLGANAQLTFGEMESIVTFDEKGEATITYTPVFEKVTKELTVNYVDEATNKTVGTQVLTLEADTTIISTNLFTEVPEGYVLAETGDVFIGANDSIDVKVRMVSTTNIIGINYWDVENNKQAGEGKVTVDAGATKVNSSQLTDIPEGYELVWTGDFDINDGWIYVEVRPVEAPPVEKTFTVTFDSNGGSAVASQTVKEGEKAAKPANPTRDGYTFEGWFADEALKTAYDFNTPVTSDITLYADWDRRSSGGGGGGGSSSTKKYIITVTCGEGGEITPDGGSDNEVEVRKGNDQTFRISADNGYRISDVLVDGESVGIVDKYTFEDVDEDHKIEAIFTRRAADPSDSGTDRYLNTKDHVQYMTGYPDGSFGPGQNMTRAEAAQMFYALLLDQNVPHTVSFSDVPADAWYAEAVNTLASLGMINGYPDGTFRPDAPITRAEFCVIALAFAYEPEDFDCDFRDVSTSDWFYDYVAQATSYGWISGADRSFRPNECITRAEVSVIVNNMLGRVADEDYIDRHEDELNTFPDVKPSHWAYYSIMETANSHDYTKNNGNENWR